mgnify:CR=1 FL=1
MTGGGKLGAMLRTVGDLMHGAGELPLTPEAAPMAQALLVMSEKRFGAAGVVGTDGRLTGLITDGDLRRHMDGLLTHRAAQGAEELPCSCGNENPPSFPSTSHSRLASRLSSPSPTERANLAAVQEAATCPRM